MLELPIELRVVAPILHDAASMRNRRSVPREQDADLGQATSAHHMCQIHGNLPREGRCGRASRRRAQILDMHLNTAATAVSIACLMTEALCRTEARGGLDG